MVDFILLVGASVLLALTAWLRNLAKPKDGRLWIRPKRVPEVETYGIPRYEPSESRQWRDAKREWFVALPLLAILMDFGMMIRGITRFVAEYL